MKNVLFVNHKVKQCGVYQYGLRSANILKGSTKYNYTYAEIENQTELGTVINAHNPIAIVYNWHPATMGWLGRNGLNMYPHIKRFGLYHEGNVPSDIFHYILFVDSTHTDTSTTFAMHRPLFANNTPVQKPSI